MDITLGKYNLSNDDRQFIVSEIKIIQDGKNAGAEIKANQTYHSTLSSAISAVLDRRIKRSEATTLIGLKSDYEAAKKWIQDQFNPDTRLSFTDAWEESHGLSAQGGRLV